MPEQNTDRPLFADEAQDRMGSIEPYAPPIQPGRELIIDGQQRRTYFDDQGVEMVLPQQPQQATTQAYLRVKTESGTLFEANHNGVATDSVIAALGAIVATISSSKPNHQAGAGRPGLGGLGKTKLFNRDSEPGSAMANRLGQVNKISATKKIAFGLAMAAVFSNTYGWTRVGGQDFIEFEQWQNPTVALSEPLMWGETIYDFGKFVISKATS